MISVRITFESLQPVFQIVLARGNARSHRRESQRRIGTNAVYLQTAWILLGALTRQPRRKGVGTKEKAYFLNVLGRASKVSALNINFRIKVEA
jgi:hypothetical protein